MKTLVYLFVISILFASCEKEQDDNLLKSSIVGTDVTVVNRLIGNITYPLRKPRIIFEDGSTIDAKQLCLQNGYISFKNRFDKYKIECAKGGHLNGVKYDWFFRTDWINNTDVKINPYTTVKTPVFSIQTDTKFNEFVGMKPYDTTDSTGIVYAEMPQ